MAKIIIDTTEKIKNKFKSEAALQGFSSLKGYMLRAAEEKKEGNNRRIYEGYYCDSFEESGLYERKEMKGYPQELLLEDVLNKNMTGKKIRITIEELEEENE